MRLGLLPSGRNPAEVSHAARYGGPVSANGWVAAPDNVAFDPKGHSSGSPPTAQDDMAGWNDSLYAANVSGPNRGVTHAFFNGPARLQKSAGQS